MLLLNASSTAVATPLTAYGNAGNDSGAFGFETIGMKEVTFQLLGAGSNAAGYTVTIYCSISPNLLYTHDNQPGFQVPYTSLRGDKTLIPAYDWSPVPGPDEDAATGGISNPLVSGGVKLLVNKSPFVVYRAVLTTVGSPTLNAAVYMFAVG